MKSSKVFSREAGLIDPYNQSHALGEETIPPKADSEDAAAELSNRMDRLWTDDANESAKNRFSNKVTLVAGALPQKKQDALEKVFLDKQEAALNFIRYAQTKTPPTRQEKRKMAEILKPFLDVKPPIKGVAQYGCTFKRCTKKDTYEHMRNHVVQEDHFHEPLYPCGYEEW
jgi:hypothetical protein